MLENVRLKGVEKNFFVKNLVLAIIPRFFY